MDKEFDYTIYRDNSPQQFKKACALIERLYPDLTKHDLLIDVDGSTIQIFGQEPKEVIIYDDYNVGAVYIKSDIELYDLATTDEITMPPLLQYA